MGRRWFRQATRVRFPLDAHDILADELPLGIGLKAVIETIDNRGDFKKYMQNYAFARGSAPSRGPRREGPSDEGFVSSIYTLQGKLNPLCLASYRRYPYSTRRRIVRYHRRRRMAPTVSRTRVVQPLE